MQSLFTKVFIRKQAEDAHEYSWRKNKSKTSCKYPLILKILTNFPEAIGQLAYTKLTLHWKTIH